MKTPLARTKTGPIGQTVLTQGFTQLAWPRRKRTKNKNKNKNNEQRTNKKQPTTNQKRSVKAEAVASRTFAAMEAFANLQQIGRKHHPWPTATYLVAMIGRMKFYAPNLEVRKFGKTPEESDFFQKAHTPQIASLEFCRPLCNSTLGGTVEQRTLLRFFFGLQIRCHKKSMGEECVSHNRWG